MKNGGENFFCASCGWISTVHLYALSSAVRNWNWTPLFKILGPPLLPLQCEIVPGMTNSPSISSGVIVLPELCVVGSINFRVCFCLAFWRSNLQIPCTTAWLFWNHLSLIGSSTLLWSSVYGSVFVSCCSRICGSSVTRYSTGFLCEAISCSSPDPRLDQ